MAQPITHDDLGKGLDGLRPEHKVKDGYWLESINFDPSLSGSISKRQGFALYAGLVPLRVRSLSLTGTTLTITLPTWVDATKFRPRRVLIWGRASKTMGALTTTNSALAALASPGTGSNITIQTTATGNDTDTSPQLVVYGLDVTRFSAKSSTARSRAGWVHHLDTFKDSETSTQWPVCAMGGNFFAAHENAHLSAGLNEQLLPRIRFAHESNLRRLGPAFWATGENPNLSRGYISRDGAETHVVPVSSIAWVSGSVARFTVEGVTASTSVSSIIRPNGDRLTVEQAPHSIFNGQFLVSAVNLAGTTLTIDCEVDGLVDDRFDAPAGKCGAFAGIFTDAMTTNGTDLSLPPGTEIDVRNATAIEFTNSAVSAASDSITVSNAFVWEDNQEVSLTKVSGTLPGGLSETTYWVFRDSDSALGLRASFGGARIDITSAGSGTFQLRVTANQERWVVLGASGYTQYVDGVTRRAAIQAGRVVQGTRSGKVTQLRDTGSATADFGTLIEGDVLSVSTQTPTVRPKVKNLGPTAAMSITQVVGDGTEATATVSSTANLAVGDQLLIAGSPHFSGEVTVSGIPDSTHFSFAHTSPQTDAVSGMAVVSNTIGVDLETEWTDGTTDTSSTAVDLFRRWQPIEFVESPNTAIIDFNTVQHLDYFADDEQPFVRSVMSHDSMYFTNGYDEVFKYDGVNLIRAGLPPQQLVLLSGEVNGLGYYPSETFQADSSDAALPAIVTDSQILTSQSAGPIHTTSAANQASSFSVGTRVSYRSTSQNNPPTISGEVTGGDGATKINVKEFILNTNTSGNFDFRREYSLAYYARLNLIDRHKRATASAITQYRDTNHNFGRWSTGQIKVTRPPAWPGLDHSRIEIQTYRRPITSITALADDQDGLLNYDLIRPIRTDWGNTQSVYTLKDQVRELPRSSDLINYALRGVEVSTQLTFPPRAKHASAAAGRLLLGNIKSYPRMSIRLIGSNPKNDDLISIYNLHGVKFRVTLGSSTTEIQLLSPGASNYVSNCQLSYSGDTSYPLKITGPAGAFSAVSVGDFVYVNNSNSEIVGGTNRTSLDYVGWTQVHQKLSDTEIRSSVVVKPSLTITGVTTGATGYITIGAGHGFQGPTLVSFTGSLPSGIVQKYTYKAVPLSDTNLALYTREPIPSRVDPTTGTTGGKVELIDIYPANGSGAASSTDVSIYWSTGGAIPVVMSPTGRKTRSYRLLTGSTGLLNQVVQWMASAINAVHSMNLTSGFRPYLIARAGEDYAAGELFLESPIAGTTTPTIRFTPTNFSGIPNILTPYANGTLMTANQEYSFESVSFPSRLCRSGFNYPDIFDDPYVESSGISAQDSAIDVDPASGGEITAVIPMFGESMYGAAQLSSSVLVAKKNGWYAVNVETKAVQKLDTNGIGCDFPRTVTSTKNGIAFANRSGIFKINRTADIVPLGQILGRKWSAVDSSDDVDESLANATHDPNRLRYTVSLPVVNNEDTDPPVHYAFSYDHTREVNPAGLSASGGTDGVGSWTEYDGIPSIGWSNMGSDSLFATVDGRVHARTRSNTELDYRDDEAAIEASATYKLLNFGVTGIRKILRGLSIAIRAVSSQAGTALSWAASARRSFQPFDDFAITAGSSIDGIADQNEAAIHNVKLSAPERKGDLMTLRVENSTLFESPEITDFTFFVDPLADHGVREADDVDP